MNKEKITISYSELKSIYNQVIEFTREKAGWFKNPDKKTCIEGDLGLYGLDNEEFLIDFSERFDVNFEKMDYEKFLTPEHDLVSATGILLLPIIILFFLTKQLMRWITYPFSKILSDAINKYHLPMIKNQFKKDVTLGDLIISVIKKEFTEMANIHLELKTI